MYNNNNNQQIEEEVPQYEAKGTISVKMQKASRNNKAFWSICMDNAWFTIWDMSMANKVDKGDQVEILYETNGQFNTIIDIISVVKSNGQQMRSPPSQRPVPVGAAPQATLQSTAVVSNNSGSKDAAIEFGMASNQAVLLIAESCHDFNDGANKLASPEYDKIVELLFNKNRTLRQKLIGQ